MCRLVASDVDFSRQHVDLIATVLFQAAVDRFFIGYDKQCDRFRKAFYLALPHIASALNQTSLFQHFNIWHFESTDELSMEVLKRMNLIAAL
jgi:hypothetical protein